MTTDGIIMTRVLLENLIKVSDALGDRVWVGAPVNDWTCLRARRSPPSDMLVAACTTGISLTSLEERELGFDTVPIQEGGLFLSEMMAGDGVPLIIGFGKA